MTEKKLKIRVFQLECPNRCTTYIYKTALAQEDINTRCVHCGSSALSKKELKDAKKVI